jgi:hypothetical protein
LLPARASIASTQQKWAFTFLQPLEIIMTSEKSTKFTFYAEPDVKEWLDSLDLGVKSKMINSLLREGMRDQKTDCAASR